VDLVGFFFILTGEVEQEGAPQRKAANGLQSLMPSGWISQYCVHYPLLSPLHARNSRLPFHTIISNGCLYVSWPLNYNVRGALPPAHAHTSGLKRTVVQARIWLEHHSSSAAVGQLCIIALAVLQVRRRDTARARAKTVRAVVMTRLPIVMSGTSGRQLQE
jgi:hypothetical protein